jgi:hypothetical protein
MSADTENIDSELQSSLRESPSGVCHALGDAGAALACRTNPYAVKCTTETSA